MQAATGQVAILVEDPESGKWSVFEFRGGPEPYEEVTRHPSRSDAEACLKARQFRKADELYG